MQCCSWGVLGCEIKRCELNVRRPKDTPTQHTVRSIDAPNRAHGRSRRSFPATRGFEDSRLWITLTCQVLCRLKPSSRIVTSLRSANRRSSMMLSPQELSGHLPIRSRETRLSQRGYPETGSLRIGYLNKIAKLVLHFVNLVLSIALVGSHES